MINKRFLPFSITKYWVDDFGDIFDGQDQKLETFVSDDKEYVKLHWYSGFQAYEKALVIMSAFGSIDHDNHLYERVLVIHKDGDRRNYFPGNLTYVFSGEPIESTYNGFYLIPGFKDYVIARDGRVLDLRKSQFKNWYVFKGNKTKNQTAGYLSSDFRRNGRSFSNYQHRLLCLVFKPVPTDCAFKSLTVNHIDAQKSNNDLSNLEWSTYSENNKHAWDNGLKLNHRNQVLMKNLITGEVRSFKSLRECGRALGDTTAFYVSSRIQDQSGRVYPDFLMFKMDDGTEWPEYDKARIPKDPSGMANAIIAKNVFTGETVVFNDPRSSGALLDIEPHIVLEHARLRLIIPNKGYNFRFLLDQHDWPEFTKEHLEIFKRYPVRPGDGVIMTDNQSGEETFFLSAKDCCEQIGIAKAHLSTLMYDGRYFKKRFSFRYFKLRESILNYESISSEASS